MKPSARTIVTSPQQRGYWLRVTEAEARALAAGTVPETVRVEFTEMMQAHDAHVDSCRTTLDKEQE
jgi:hypothetical protein